MVVFVVLRVFYEDLKTFLTKINYSNENQHLLKNLRIRIFLFVLDKKRSSNAQISVFDFSLFLRFLRWSVAEDSFTHGWKALCVIQICGNTPSDVKWG